MSDWDFLHEMRDEGYSAEQVAFAAAIGYNPFAEWIPEAEEVLSEANPELVQIFEELVDSAKAYHALTGRYLQIWGELGELFAEITYGIIRHKPHTQGSDGKLGNDFVEIKTLSPENSAEKTLVKLSGNFNKLVVVKISKDFEFESQLLNRKSIAKGNGKHARVSWSSLAAKRESDSP